uniref:PDZ domain-containing protein n=1 Tax=Apis cerana TaxID=7461 RepID=V9IIJ5_APICE
MEDEPRDTCFGAGNVAGAVIGTFLTTILLLLIAALLYRQWRRHKGKHLVLVTDPEIVEEAYAFDNPCFKDVTISSNNRNRETAISLTPGDTPGKDSTRWSTSWTSLGLGSTNRNDKRKTLDDSCLGPKATRINIVSLKSRDFTGLGFNICGNMREGIFVKDLLHRGPASESGRIHPGDRIASVKISFRNMVYEDALTILSYASPYDVKLEVENGGIGSKPTTLLKKSVGPSAARICHPLYRSQSIPELSQSKSIAKRLFIVDPNESMNSNYSTMNSTLKSSKSISNSQTFEKSHDESKNNHHKFGIKVLPSLDGTVHRIENQNEHNTNLERRHSKKLNTEKHLPNMNKTSLFGDKKEEVQCQQTSQISQITKGKNEIFESHNVDVLNKNNTVIDTSIHVPSEVPTEVHNAAMAARRNRKNSSELLNSSKNIESIETEDSKNQQKNKRKAPPPPKSNNYDESPKKDSSSTKIYDSKKEDEINSITDYKDSLSDYIKKVRETEKVDSRVEEKVETLIIDERHSESDTDSEIQNSFTTIELNSADITIHRTPVPEINNDEDEEDDVYRKAASLGDLSKYECKTSTTLERAQSLDMTDTGTKKRKAPLPPEDINESTEDLTKLDQIDTFDRRLLKKSNEWGNLEDVVWRKKLDSEDKLKKSNVRKKNKWLTRTI